MAYTICAGLLIFAAILTFFTKTPAKKMEEVLKVPLPQNKTAGQQVLFSAPYESKKAPFRGLFFFAKKGELAIRHADQNRMTFCVGVYPKHSH